MSNISIESLMQVLPEVLHRDDNMHALGAAASYALTRHAEDILAVSIYPNIDSLPEALLDILAYDFKIDWYDYDYSIEEKRQTIKDNWMVHKHLGTKWAVITALKAVYEDVEIQEWFEYGGEPYHFKLTVYSTNDLLFDLDFQNRVLQLVNYYKSLRSHNDAVDYVVAPSKDAIKRAELHTGGAFASRFCKVCVKEAV